MATSIYIFNQYYIDLLKKIKTISKKHKNKSKTAQKVLKTIKDNYMTLDKTSEEYLKFLNENFSDDIWKSYLELENNDNINEWFVENGNKEVFINISLNDIIRILRDNYLCHHYCSVFYIFRNDIEEEQSELIIKVLQTINNTELLSKIDNEEYNTIIVRLEDLRNKSIKDKAGIDMNSIEETSLGKLAKEILDDIDVSKLKESIGDDGDVLKAISDPNSGFSDLLTNVSKKMASKISSGELNQENLLQDAMKFATLMPGMFGQQGGQGGQGGKGSKGPDMSDLMGMMGSMMNDKSGGGMPNMNDLFKNMAGNTGGGKKGKSHFDDNKMKKMYKMKQMREKLNKKKMNEEDMEVNDP